MTDKDLTKHYKQLLENAAMGQQPAVPAQGQPPEAQVGPVPPAQPTEVSPEVTVDRQTSMSFAPNPHRFKFQQGDEVAFYDETGNMIIGTIAADQVENRYNVVDANNTSHDIMKNELFFPPGGTLAEQAPGAQSSA